MYRENKYIKFTRNCLAACRAARIRYYSCKKSKKVYTQHQLIAICSLMKLNKSHYRDIVELIEVTESIKQELELTNIPHYTTLHKFMQRFRGLNILISKMLNNYSTLAIDASGFSCSHASLHYMKRINKTFSKRMFVKNSICVDIKTRMIVSSITSMSNIHDNKHFIPLLESLSGYELVLADKGYDSEKNHKYVRNNKAESLIPVKRNIRRGYWRKKMKNIDMDRYHQRSLVETVFSVIKRKFGSVVYSRTERIQIKEVQLLNFVYNIDRRIKSSILCNWLRWMISTEPKK